MRDATLGVPDRRLDQAAVTGTRGMTSRRRIGLAVVVLLHGLAHANAGTWPGPAMPFWLTSVLWDIAMLGYLGAGLGLLRVPVVGRVYRPLMTAATMGSIALLTTVGGPIAFVGIAMDLVFLTLVIHWARVGENAPIAPSTRHPRLTLAGRTFALLFLAYATLVTLVHPIYLTWGTTAAEREAMLPGDDFVPDARYRVDHAITIRAPVDSVWPWLVQLGQDRGGFYSYAWLERLVGDDVHNADRIHPEWQQLKPGDLVRATQPDYLGGRFGELGWRVRDIVPGRAIVLENWGAFVVQPVDARTTRFFIRTRGDGTPSLAGVLLGPLNAFVFEPAHFIMQRGMMRGVRERAEFMMGGNQRCNVLPRPSGC
jgi:hypothetical protein